MDEVNHAGLRRDGYAVLHKVVLPEELAEFEAAIDLFAAQQASALGISHLGAEPFIDVFRVGGVYTKRIYELLERLDVLGRITARISHDLARSGFMTRYGIRVPLVWPDIRADLPHDASGSLAVHQDFGSTKCARAWRLWIPLRPSNAVNGSMLAYPGTHQLGVVPHSLHNPLHPTVPAEFYAGIEPVVFDLPAGHGVLMNPLLLHASVPNRGDRTKFTLMIQVQDYSAVINPSDAQSEFAPFAAITSARTQARTMLPVQ